MAEIKTRLSADERKAKLRCDEAISYGKAQFVRVGLALAEYRDRRLYREQFGTFEDYCQKVHNWTRDRVYKLIESAKIKAALPSNVENFIQSPGQASVLAKVPEAKRAQVLAIASGKARIAQPECAQRLAKISAKLTAASISEATKSLEAADNEELVDELGHKIPDGLKLRWIAADIVATRLEKLSHEVALTIRHGVQGNDPAFKVFGQQEVSEADSFHHKLKNNLAPFTVCPKCAGRGTDTLCYRRGYISKFQWNNILDKETKELWSRSK